MLTEGSGAVLEPSFETVSRDGGVVRARGGTPRTKLTDSDLRISAPVKRRRAPGEPGHTRDTRAHTGTRITNTDVPHNFGTGKSWRCAISDET